MDSISLTLNYDLSSNRSATGLMSGLIPLSILSSPPHTSCLRFNIMVRCKSCKKRDGKGRFTDCNSKVVYCSKACQIANWPLHIFDCYAYRRKTVPYHFAHSRYRDLLPTDKQTLEDSGLIMVLT